MGDTLVSAARLMGTVQPQTRPTHVSLVLPPPRAARPEEPDAVFQPLSSENGAPRAWFKTHAHGFTLADAAALFSQQQHKG